MAGYRELRESMVVFRGKGGIMNIRVSGPGYSIAVLACICLLAGCGGTKVLKEAQPMQLTQPLGAVSNQKVTATLDWVIVRDGPGTWAKNADWDEYLLRVDNQSGQPINVTGIMVIDSLDTQIEPRQERKQLVKGSKRSSKRRGVPRKRSRSAAFRKFG